MDTSLVVAKNWRHAIKAAMGARVKIGTNAVDGDTNEGRVEAIFCRKSSKLEGRFRMKEAKKTREDGLQLHKTCFVGPRPMRLWGI